MSLRQLFPQLSEQEIYLDNAATTFMPFPVLDVIRQFNAKTYSSVYRSIYRRAEEATAAFEDVRSKVATFIGATDVNSIVFTKGSTEGLNHIAWSWAFHILHEGDEIVLTELEHHANITPWLEIARLKKCTIRWIPVTSNGCLDISEINNTINAKTKLVSCNWVSNVTGLQSPLAEIAQRTKAVGAALVIDAAQAVAHKLVNVQSFEPDFLVFSAHKMHGPSGVGVLYVSPTRHHEIKPHYTGGGMVLELDKESVTYRSMPHLLEAGTPPITSVMGLGAAIDFVSTYINSKVINKEYRLVKKIYDFLKSHPAFTILGDCDADRTLISFSLKDIHPHDVAAYLAEHGIAVRAGFHCAQPVHTALGVQGSVRISVACFNTDEEINAVIELLSSLITS
jgi:SufS family cysteine desulfurase